MKGDIQKLKKDMADVQATQKLIIESLGRIEAKLDAVPEVAFTKKRVTILIDRLAAFA